MKATEPETKLKSFYKFLRNVANKQTDKHTSAGKKYNLLMGRYISFAFSLSSSGVLSSIIEFCCKFVSLSY